MSELSHAPLNASTHSNVCNNNNNTTTTNSRRSMMVAKSKSTATPARKRSQWMEQSVVQRSVASVQTHVDRVVESSSFLRSNTTARAARFHRSEIITNEILGSGGFALVHEISEFRLDPSVSERCTEHEQRLREQVAASAIDENGNGKYALKHLKKRLLLSQKLFQRAVADLVVEGEYMARLDHENIVSVQGLPMDGVNALKQGNYDSYFLVLDRLECTLGDRIRDWSTSPGTAPPLKTKAGHSLEIAKALEYLHLNRIVYRDLKPDNIGFGVNGSIQLFDFGLSRELPGDDLNEVYDMSGVGTRRYMAVEVINSECYNLKADVYAWSMVCWEILTHTKPYAAYGPEEHRTNVCEQGERPIIDEEAWPVWMQCALRNSWREDVSDRWSISTVVDELEDCLVEVPSSPPSRSPVKFLLDAMDSPRGVEDWMGDLDCMSAFTLTLPMLPPMVTPSKIDRRMSCGPKLRHGPKISAVDIINTDSSLSDMTDGRQSLDTTIRYSSPVKGGVSRSMFYY